MARILIFEDEVTLARALRADDDSAVSDAVKKRFRVEYDDCRWILITKQK